MHCTDVCMSLPTSMRTLQCPHTNRTPTDPQHQRPNVHYGVFGRCHRCRQHASQTGVPVNYYVETPLEAPIAVCTVLTVASESAGVLRPLTPLRSLDRVAIMADILKPGQAKSRRRRRRCRRHPRQALRLLRLPTRPSRRWHLFAAPRQPFFPETACPAAFRTLSQVYGGAIRLVVSHAALAALPCCQGRCEARGPGRLCATADPV